MNDIQVDTVKPELVEKLRDQSAVPSLPDKRGDFQDMLYKRFPHLFELADADISISPMAFGIECGPGWWPLIWRLCELIEEQARHETEQEGLDESYSPRIHQVKEKFGSLRVYHDGSDAVDDLAYAAEALSEQTCERCGALGASSSGSGWVRTRCPHCTDG